MLAHHRLREYPAPGNIFFFNTMFNCQNDFAWILGCIDGTGEVMNTNYCNISVCKNREENKVIIISAIDNLIKGASGQAVQNMNVAFKLKETMGLI